MARYEIASQSLTQVSGDVRIVQGAVIAATTKAGSAATLYSSETGATTVDSVQSDANGNWSFWVNRDDYYTVSVSKDGSTTSFRVEIPLMYPGTDPVSVSEGGTGATTPEAARLSLGANNFKDYATLSAADLSGLSTGDYLTAKEIGYSVAASSATDHHLTTAGGVKLYIAGEIGLTASAGFGAVGDGVTDDTAALNLLGAITTGVILDAGANYKITDTVTFLGNVDFNGAKITYEGTRDRPAVVFGTRADKQESLTFKGVHVVSSTVDWSDREYVGAVFHNQRGANIHIKHIEDFATSFRLHSTSGGCTHCNVTVDRIVNFKYGLDLLCDGGLSGTNYVNENNFFGGEWTNYTSDTDTLGDCYAHVYRHINGGYREHNNNRFWGPSFQLKDGQSGDERIPVLMDQVGRHNYYYRARHETGRGPFARIVGDTGASEDFIENVFEVGLLSGSNIIEGIQEESSAKNSVYRGMGHDTMAQGSDLIHIAALASVRSVDATDVQTVGPCHFVDSSGNLFDEPTNIQARKDSLFIKGARGFGFYTEIEGGVQSGFVLRQEVDGIFPRLGVALFDAKFRRIDPEAADWAASTAYAVGDQVTNGGNIYYCVTAGTSDTSGGPAGETSSITDGTAVWDFQSEADCFAGQRFGSSKPWQSASYGGFYRQSDDGLEFPFRVGPNVKYLQCLAVRQSASGAGLKSMSLTQFNGPRVNLQPFSGYERDDAEYSVKSTFGASPGVVGMYRSGQIIPVEGAASGDTSYFQCTTTGRLANAWAGSATVTAGAIAANGGNIYNVTTGGTTAASGGPTGTGSDITDGTVVWDYLCPEATFISGPLIP